MSWLIQGDEYGTAGGDQRLVRAAAAVAARNPDRNRMD
jgi:hypothetical protein